MIFRNLLFAIVGLVAIAALLAWLARGPSDPPSRTPLPAPLPPLRIRLGLIPDRNLYAQRRAYLALADYLDSHLRPARGISTLDAPPAVHVELVTSHNYAGVLQDFASQDVDAAFLGSLVAVLAVDRYGAQVLVKSETSTGMSTYAGTLFVREDSPITSISELAGRNVAAVRTTMAGSIFPLVAFQHAGIPPGQPPFICWSGTHDDVIDDVLANRVDAGAVKDLRLESWLQSHPGVSFRRLSTGPRAPENALVISRDFPPALRESLLATLLAMQHDPQARPVLDALQLRRFLPCDLSEYAPLYDMIDTLRPRWNDTGIDGPAPKRPSAAATAPAAGGS